MPLRNWEKWSERGREYLGALGNKVKLADIVNEYTFAVANFYRWFVERQFELHRETLKELEQLDSKKEQLQRELRGLDDPWSLQR